MDRSLRRRILASLAAASVAFGVAELTVRIVLPPLGEQQDREHPMAGWAFVDAFCAYRARPSGTLGSGKSVDADGFISTPPWSQPKPDGVLRVAFLGGSSTACTVPPIPDAETWPWLAARGLEQELGTKVEFLNAALPGYSSFESYGRLWSRVRFFEPDLVVVYHAWNDLYYFANVDRVRNWRTQQDGDWSFSKPSVYRVADRHPVDDLLGWSELLRRVGRAVLPAAPGGEVGAATNALATSWDPRAPAIFRQNLRLLVAAQQALGFELLVAKQATLITADLPPALRAKCKYGLHGFDHDAHVRAFDAIYDVIDEEVPAAQIIDCTSLSGVGPDFVDHVHLSERGCVDLAALMVPQLVAAARRGSAAPRPGR